MLIILGLEEIPIDKTINQIIIEENYFHGET